MSRIQRRAPLLAELYRHYEIEQDAARLVRRACAAYTPATLARLTVHPDRLARRGAVLVLGLIGDSSVGPELGMALRDGDRGVRLLAQQAARQVWRRTAGEAAAILLARVTRQNSAGQYQAALAESQRLVQRYPDFAEAWNQLAVAAFGLGDYEESIRACRQALELNPYHYGAAAGEGQCHVRQGQLLLALECFQRALTLNPDLEGVRANVAWLQKRLGSNPA